MVKITTYAEQAKQQMKDVGFRRSIASESDISAITNTGGQNLGQGLWQAGKDVLDEQERQAKEAAHLWVQKRIPDSVNNITLATVNAKERHDSDEFRTVAATKSVTGYNSQVRGIHTNELEASMAAAKKALPGNKYVEKYYRTQWDKLLRTGLKNAVEYEGRERIKLKLLDLREIGEKYEVRAGDITDVDEFAELKQNIKETFKNSLGILEDKKQGEIDYAITLPPAILEEELQRQTEAAEVSFLSGMLARDPHEVVNMLQPGSAFLKSLSMPAEKIEAFRSRAVNEARVGSIIAKDDHDKTMNNFVTQQTRLIDPAVGTVETMTTSMVADAAEQVYPGVTKQDEERRAIYRNEENAKIRIAKLSGYIKDEYLTGSKERREQILSLLKYLDGGHQGATYLKGMLQNYAPSPPNKETKVTSFSAAGIGGWEKWPYPDKPIKKMNLDRYTDHHNGYELLAVMTTADAQAVVRTIMPTIKQINTMMTTDPGGMVLQSLENNSIRNGRSFAHRDITAVLSDVANEENPKLRALKIEDFGETLLRLKQGSKELNIPFRFPKVWTSNVANLFKTAKNGEQFLQRLDALQELTGNEFDSLVYATMSEHDNVGLGFFTLALADIKATDPASQIGRVMLANAALLSQNDELMKKELNGINVGTDTNSQATYKKAEAMVQENHEWIRDFARTLHNDDINIAAEVESQLYRAAISFALAMNRGKGDDFEKDAEQIFGTNSKPGTIGSWSSLPGPAEAATTFAGALHKILYTQRSDDGRVSTLIPRNVMISYGWTTDENTSYYTKLKEPVRINPETVHGNAETFVKNFKDLDKEDLAGLFELIIRGNTDLPDIFRDNLVAGGFMQGKTPNLAAAKFKSGLPYENVQIKLPGGATLALLTADVGNAIALESIKENIVLKTSSEHDDQYLVGYKDNLGQFVPLELQYTMDTGDESMPFMIPMSLLSAHDGTIWESFIGLFSDRVPESGVTPGAEKN